MIVGAHYDVCEDQPGADDNASAIAGLLEISRIINIYKDNLKYRVDFVAYTLEEPPFFTTEAMGSYVHAKEIHDRKIDVRGMICLEMIGFFTEEKTQQYPLPLMKIVYPIKGNFIGVVGDFNSVSLVNEVSKYIKTAAIDVSKLYAPAAVPGVDFSDHRSYWSFGYKAVMITDTAFYRNPNYHSESDTIDTLDFDKMVEVVSGLCFAIMNFK